MNDNKTDKQANSKTYRGVIKKLSAYNNPAVVRTTHNVSTSGM